MAEIEKTKYSISTDTLIRLGVYLIFGIIAYTNMNNKIDAHTVFLSKIEISQKEQTQKWEMERQAMSLQIQECQTRLAIIDQQLKDMQDIQNSK